MFVERIARLLLITQVVVVQRICDAVQRLTNQIRQAIVYLGDAEQICNNLNHR